MNLADFFAPLNFYNLSIFLVAFIIFDAIGIRIASFLKSPSYFRTNFWVWGLAIFIFIWFLLHFFLPFWPVYVWITLIISGLIALPGYIKRKEFVSLFREVINFPFPLLILLIVAKPVYFLVSSPPFYTDELAYHFYSPAKLMTEISWPFLSGVGLYEMVPKFLETSFIVMFALTKTYATARLLHFLLVFSVIYTIGKYLKENINLVSGVVYVFITMFISPDFITSSTQGYVDAGATAFSVLFLITLVETLSKKDKKSFYTAAIILGMAISMKYTVLAFIGSALIIGAGFILIINHQRMRYYLSNIKSSFIAVLLTLIFGGYWYVKNALLTGNPIYPFLFKCFKSIKCQTGYDYFSSWSTPLDPQHFLLIRSIIFQNSNLLLFATFASLFFALFVSIIFKKTKIILLSIIIPLSVTFEIFLSKNISGFELRYFYHWVLFIPISIVLPFIFFSNNKIINRKFSSIFQVIIAVTILFSAGIVSKNTIKRIYESDFVPGQIRNYAMRRINLNQWVDYYYPQMSEFIKWCGEKKSMQNILIVDPSLLWSGYEVNAYVVNCKLIVEGIPEGKNVEDYAEEIKSKYAGSYIVSMAKCSQEKPELSFKPDQGILRRHMLNTKLICDSKEVIRNLYLLR